MIDQTRQKIWRMQKKNKILYRFMFRHDTNKNTKLNGDSDKYLVWHTFLNYLGPQFAIECHLM